MSTKLIPKIKTTNPNFLEEAGEYLEAHGFIRNESPSRPGQIFFFLKSDIAIEVCGDRMDFAQYHPGDDDCAAAYRTFHSFTGIGTLDLFGYMLLFHITGVATIRELYRGAIKQGVRFTGEEVLGSMLSHFKVTGNHHALPMCY